MAGVLKETRLVKEYWLEPSSRAVEPSGLAVTDLEGRTTGRLDYSPGAGLEVRLSPTTRTGILIDFGREVGGRLRLRFGNGSCRRLGVQMAESEKHLRNILLAGAGKRLDPVSVTRHVRAREGREQVLGHCGGFRYAWLYPECPGRVTLAAVGLDYTPHVADPEECGYFLCSDEGLNRAWFAGLHTVQMCTIDPSYGGVDGRHGLGRYDWVMVDGAKRDRLVWSADLSPAGVALYVSFNESSAIRDSLLSLARHQEKSGYIPACTPSPLTARVAAGLFADHTAWWVVVLYQYFLHTGDVEFAREMFPVVKRALAYIRGQCRGGMFRQSPLNMLEWCFTVMRFGRPSYTNVLYYWALNSASAIAHDLGEHDVSVGYVSRAFRLGENLERTLFEEDRGIFVDTTADRGRMPQDANSLAIVSGLVGEPSAAGRMLAAMRERLWVSSGSTNVDVPYYRLTPGLQPHNRRVLPFMNNFEALARFSAGDDEGAMELIRRCWGGMVDSEPGSTFWEWKGRNGGVDNHLTSLCHSGSAGVTPLLSKYVLGIRPSSPGYGTFKLDPRPVGLDWAEGRVRAPGGFIEARVERKKDGGYRTRVRAPGGCRRVS